MSLRWQIIITAGLAALLAAGWLWLPAWDGEAVSQDKLERSATATPVLVEPLHLAEDRVAVNVIGTGEALKSAAIYPKVSGEVVEVLFEPGQRVAAGAPLVRLDDEHERLAVRLAQVVEQEAMRQVKRFEKLAPSGTVSTVSLESAQTELESAGLRLAQAKADLEDRTVFAPFDGVIGLTQVDKGDRVTDETLIAILDDRSFVLVEFNVPEEYVSRIALGDEIHVRAWTRPDLDLSGTISAMDSRIEAATRSLKVKARIPNPDDTIRPGTSFDVRLDVVGGRHPLIREVAVLWSRDGAYLWRVAGDRAEKVFVDVVRRNDGRVLVEGPLEVGDLIVVEGVQSLRDGLLVEPAPFDGAPAGQPGLSGLGGEG